LILISYEKCFYWPTINWKYGGSIHLEREGKAYPIRFSIMNVSRLLQVVELQLIIWKNWNG